MEACNPMVHRPSKLLGLNLALVSFAKTYVFIYLKIHLHAAYLFKEEGNGYKGKRLFLKKVREEEATDLLYELRKRTYPPEVEARDRTKFLVFFEITKELPLVGGGE